MIGSACMAKEERACHLGSTASHPMKRIPCAFRSRKDILMSSAEQLLNGYEQGKENYSGDFTQGKVREKIFQAAFGGREEKPSGDTVEGKKKGKREWTV